MFELDVRLCCDWLCKVGVCFCFAAFVDGWCLNSMFGYFPIGNVNLVSAFVLPYLLMIGV